MGGSSNVYPWVSWIHQLKNFVDFVHQGSESFISEMVESEVRKVSPADVRKGYTVTTCILQVEWQIRFLVECIHFSDIFFLNVEVIRQYFSTCCWTNLAIKQRLTSGKVGGLIAQKNLKAMPSFGVSGGHTEVTWLSNNRNGTFFFSGLKNLKNPKLFFLCVFFSSFFPRKKQ